jgi:hypothetical protein
MRTAIANKGWNLRDPGRRTQALPLGRKPLQTHMSTLRARRNLDEVRKRSPVTMAEVGRTPGCL